MTLRTLAAACLSLVLAAPAVAQTTAANWPSRPVTIVVPFSAGGTVDIIGRMVAEDLQKKFGQPFIVENVGGAGGVTGVDRVVRSAPDGQTIVLASTSNLAVLPTLMGEKFPYRTLRDLKPITQVTVVPNVLVVNPKEISARTVPELIAYLKANPDKVSFGSSGIGTTQHLAGEMFMQKTGTKMVHVPYKGSSAMLPDLISGNVQLSFDNVPLLLPHVKTGKLVALAVTTPKRAEFDPNLPAMAEFVPGFEAVAWHGFLAPAGTPDEITKKLSDEIRAFMQKPETIKKMEDMGVTPVATSPAEFADLIKSQTEVWKQVIEAGKIKPE